MGEERPEGGRTAGGMNPTSYAGPGRNRVLGKVSGPTSAQVREQRNEALTGSRRQITAHSEVMNRVTTRRKMREGQSKLAPTGCNRAEKGAKGRFGRRGT